MLFPFHGYLFDGSDPATSAVAAARSRRIREAARRYQPDGVLTRAVSEGQLRPSPRPRLFRYRITEPSGRVVDGLVGEVPVEGLVPHEATKDSLVEPSPVVEIRPILLVTRHPLPRTRTVGARVGVVDGRLRHEVAPVRGGDPALTDAVLVIADGHHRVRAVRQSRGKGARIMAVVIGDAGRGLTVGTFHRRFTGAGPLPADVEAAFDVTPTRRRGPVRDGLVWVQGSGDRFQLVPRAEALEAVPAPLRGSLAAVAAACLYPLAGMAEREAGYFASSEAAVSGLAPGDVALLLAPPTMGSVLAAAEAGTPLPPKGTRFAPKPVRGLVIRLAGGR